MYHLSLNIGAFYSNAECIFAATHSQSRRWTCVQGINRLLFTDSRV